MFRGCLSVRILDNFIPGTVRLLLCVCLHSHPSHIYTRRRLLRLFKLSMYTRINWLLTFPFGVLKGGDCCCICNVVCCNIPYEHCGDRTSLNCAGSWATGYCFPIKCDTQCFLNSLFPTFLSNERIFEVCNVCECYLNNDCLLTIRWTYVVLFKSSMRMFISPIYVHQLTNVHFLVSLTLIFWIWNM